MAALRLRRFVLPLALITIAVLSLLAAFDRGGLGPRLPFLHPDTPPAPPPTEPEVPPAPPIPFSARAVLTSHSHLPPSFPFSDIPSQPPSETPFLTLGMPVAQFALPAELIDLEGTYGGPFNPAVLRLPHGAKWEFIVVARGPQRRREDVLVAGVVGNEQTLVAFGANLTSQHSTLVPVSHAIYLPFPTSHSTACGYWAFTFGPEDPRLYWTDDFRPLLLYGRVASDPALCRSEALVRDLRAVWPELGEVLGEVGQAGVPPVVEPWGGDHGMGVEINVADPMTTEKNWAIFYPGAAPSSSSASPPHIHYFLQPPVHLLPPPSSAFSTHDSVIYSPGPSMSPARADCLRRHHPHVSLWIVHQATPLYRVTLCQRGACVPDETNTLLVGLVQIKDRPTYGRFIITWNVTSPHEFVSVGPEWNYAGWDATGYYYALSLIFLPSPFAAPSAVRHTEQLYNPGHGFLDDEALVSLGVHDSWMATVRVPVVQLLQGHKMCEDEGEEG